MKKTDEEVAHCCTCSPFRLFEPPNAAQKAKEHYDAGIHSRTDYSSVEVHGD